MRVLDEEYIRQMEVWSRTPPRIDPSKSQQVEFWTRTVDQGYDPDYERALKALMPGMKVAL
jgi:hypothetical protein